MTQPGSLADSVAAELRAELARRRLTGAWLARELEVSEMYLSRRLSGQIPFDLVDLERVTAVLEVPVTYFLPVGETTHPGGGAGTGPSGPAGPRPSGPPPPKGASAEGRAA